jgi:glutathione synthase/RimK-type ligase-like ATP-grasp enzyme
MTNTPNKKNLFDIFIYTIMKNFRKYIKQFKQNILNKDDSKIQIGDYVKAVDYSGLTEKQENWLRSKDYFKVDNIVIKNKKRFVDIGYNIPLKITRFEVTENPFLKYKYKVLFLSFDLRIDLMGEKDTNNYFRGCKDMKGLFTTLLNEKSPDIFVNFSSYDKVYRYLNEYYIEDIKLTDYNFVFFGFMSANTTLSNLLVNYVEKKNIPHIKYGTYEHFNSKAYQFDLLETLNYSYVPSVLTTNLTKNIIKTVESFEYPVIVKDVNIDKGKGIFKINNTDELVTFFKSYNKLVLIQKFIPNDGEYRIITIKNEVALVAKKDAIDDVNTQNIYLRKSKKGILPDNILNMCVDISKHLFTDIVGFDIIQNKNSGEYYVLETNASPHFCMFSVVSDVSIPDKIVDYIIEKIK